jgi:hypothetical protein
MGIPEGAGRSITLFLLIFSLACKAGAQAPDSLPKSDSVPVTVAGPGSPDSLTKNDSVPVAIARPDSAAVKQPADTLVSTEYFPWLSLYHFPQRYGISLGYKMYYCGNYCSETPYDYPYLGLVKYYPDFFISLSGSAFRRLEGEFTYSSNSSSDPLVPRWPYHMEAEFGQVFRPDFIAAKYSGILFSYNLGLEAFGRHSWTLPDDFILLLTGNISASICLLQNLLLTVEGGSEKEFYNNLVHVRSNSNSNWSINKVIPYYPFFMQLSVTYLIK